MLDSVASYSWGATQFSGPERSVSVVSAEVEPGFFQVLRLNAALGRTFRKGDDQRIAISSSSVLSHDIWEEQFDGDPRVLGQRVSLDGRPRTVIGVLPRNFHLL